MAGGSLRYEYNNSLTKNKLILSSGLMFVLFREAMNLVVILLGLRVMVRLRRSWIMLFWKKLK